MATAVASRCPFSLCTLLAAARSSRCGAGRPVPPLSPRWQLKRSRRQQTAVGSSSSGGGGSENGIPQRCPPPIDRDSKETLSFLGGDMADSDTLFLGKLLLIALVGGSIVKYGSLFIDLPFQPNPAAACTIVLLPPAVWAAQALARRS